MPTARSWATWVTRALGTEVPPTWRDLHGSDQRLLCQDLPPAQVPGRLSVSPERWQQIQTDAMCLQGLAQMLR